MPNLSKVPDEKLMKHYITVNDQLSALGTYLKIKALGKPLGRTGLLNGPGRLLKR